MIKAVVGVFKLIRFLWGWPLVAIVVLIGMLASGHHMSVKVPAMGRLLDVLGVAVAMAVVLLVLIMIGLSRAGSGRMPVSRPPVRHQRSRELPEPLSSEPDLEAPVLSAFSAPALAATQTLAAEATVSASYVSGPAEPGKPCSGPGCTRPLPQNPWRAGVGAPGQEKDAPNEFCSEPCAELWLREREAEAMEAAYGRKRRKR
jgi:hypothetical protein